MTATVIALGLATAAAYGASDFLGGLASRRAGASLAVVALMKLVAVGLFAAAIPLVGGGAPSGGALVWGALAGLAVGAAYIAYFRALAGGRMGLVATVTAVWSAVVPLLAGVLIGERPSALSWAGIAAIVVAIVLITYARERAQPDAERFSARSVLEATAAGIGFGMFFVALDRAGAAAASGGLAWPLLVAAATAAVLVGAVAVALRVDWSAALRQAPAVVGAGVLYAAGSWAFIVAVSEGWISIVAVLVALSPAPTMLLARVLLGESLSARQALGAALALAGVALVTAGLPA